MRILETAEIRINKKRCGCEHRPLPFTQTWREQYENKLGIHALLIAASGNKTMLIICLCFALRNLIETIWWPLTVLSAQKNSKQREVPHAEAITSHASQEQA